MDGNTAVEVGLGGAHLDSNTKALQHLANAKTKDVQTDDLLLGTGADNLHLGGVLGLLLSGHDGVVHVGELGVVGLDLVIAVLLAGFGLSKTDGANLGVREDNSGDVLVGELGSLELGRAEDAATELATSGNCDCKLVSGLSCDSDAVLRTWSQLSLASHITKGVDTLDGSVLVLVDSNVTTGAKFHTRDVELQILDLWGTTNSPQELVHLHLGTVIANKLDQTVGTLSVANKLDLLETGVVFVHLDTGRLIPIGHGLLDHRVELAQELLTTDEHVSLNVHSIHHTCKLDSNVASTDDSNLRGSSSISKKPSLVIPCSAPGTVGMLGRPPVASRMCFPA